jgi:hypothetical protein
MGMHNWLENGRSAWSVLTPPGTSNQITPLLHFFSLFMKPKRCNTAILTVLNTFNALRSILDYRSKMNHRDRIEQAQQ